MLVVQISLFSNLWILYEDFKNIPVFFTGFVIKSNLYSTVFFIWRNEIQYNHFLSFEFKLFNDVNFNVFSFNRKI